MFLVSKTIQEQRNNFLVNMKYMQPEYKACLYINRPCVRLTNTVNVFDIHRCFLKCFCRTSPLVESIKT